MPTSPSESPPSSERWLGLTDAEAGHALLRVTLGLNIFLHGVVRLVSGPGAFSATLVKAFAGSLMPELLVRPFALALPFAETAVGLLVTLGLRTRPALAAGGLLMMALVVGTALRSEWETLGVQMLYVALYAALLGTARFGRCSVDGLLASRPPRARSRRGHAGVDGPGEAHSMRA
ncbi:DoxX family membrane protein [Corallococcus sp. H22C18031201]|uniref:DoxX family membrane protein n=1 Tax=Citreicoccus inhibens TaxID=2849499 RepID=UPI000E71A282|nr:DoxX family membrane protein [Citreicoccus inhibens]MBU8895201.1 DoxX family membrane protein [Citreicoccus inhibens]RJS27336.1 DoxX family membrane protein [Corallococcus sp. H22C18031201]